jgi:dTDP-glucose 4,6-dehydratase
MNVFGERQHPEKFIPKVIKQLLEGETVEVYTDENGIVGSRFYIHADDVAKILVDIVENPTGQLKENIGGVCEIDNYEMANFIADVMGINMKAEHKSFDLGKSCHDIRYDIDPTLLAFWTTEEQMYEQLRETIKWTAAHPGWLEW